MSAVLEARAVITAVDETGKAFTSVKERIAAIVKMTEVMNRALGSVGAVSKNVEAFKLPSSAISDMSKFVETTARVDKTMANVNRSAVAMASNVGKTSAEVVGLSAKLLDAGAKLKAIQDFKSTGRGVKEAALAAQKAQQDARLLAAKIDGTPTPTRSMQAAHNNALTEVRETERALAKQAEIATQARTSLAEMGVPLNRLAAEEERLKSVVTGTNDALLRQIQIEREGAVAAEKAAAAQRMSADQERRHHEALMSRLAKEEQARHRLAPHSGGGHSDHGFANYALTSAAMAVSAHEITNVIREGWHEGSELQHERMQLKNAGRSPEEMREIEGASRKVISDLPTASFTESMKVVAETTSAFGSVHHAIDNLPFMMKAISVLKSAGGDHIRGDAAAVGQAFAKVFEERQTHPEDFQKEASAMIPAMVATGGLFNPEQLYAFAQQAKSALPNYDMRFLSKIAPSLITAQGGERAGTAANAFNSIIMGKVNDKKQTEAWEKFGLLDESKVLKKAGHAVSWTAGAVEDTDLALTDPLEWAEKVVLPAMRDKGVDVDNRLELAKVLGTMFRNQNGNMFANEIMQAASRARLHKDEALYGKTGDLDEIYKNDLGEFNVAAGALGTALKTLGAAATAPMMHRTAEALSALSGAMNRVSAFGLQHPTIAATAGVTAAGGALAAAGWLGKKLFDGFGLKGSAVALTGSASAIDAAAARLGRGGGGGGGGGGGNAVNRAENVAEGAAGGRLARGIVGGEGAATTEQVVAAAIPEVVTGAAGVIAFGGAFALTGLVKEAMEAQAPGKGGLYADATEATRPSDQRDLADLRIERDNLKAEIERARAMEKIPGTADAEVYRRQNRIDELNIGIAKKERSLVDLDAVASHEARIGRAMMALPKPEEFGPALPAGWSPKFQRPLDSEQAGPYQPHLPDTDRQDRARNSDLGTFSRYRRADDPWLEGDRQGIEERARRGAAMFRQDHESAIAPHMMHDAGVSPQVDTSGLDAAKTKGGEVQEVLAALAAMVISPSVNSSALDALIAKATQAKALIASLGSGSGTSGSVGPSYPQTAPTGRMGPR